MLERVNRKVLLEDSGLEKEIGEKRECLDTSRKKLVITLYCINKHFCLHGKSKRCKSIPNRLYEAQKKVLKLNKTIQNYPALYC